MDEAPRTGTHAIKIRVKRFTGVSLFKLVFIINGAVWIPVMVLFGVFALFGAKTVTVSGEHVTGIKGLAVAVTMAPIFAFFLSGFIWMIAYLGARLFGHFWSFDLEYLPGKLPGADAGNPPSTAPKP